MVETIKGISRTHLCGELSIANAEEEVTIMGWVHKNRNKGGLVFVDVRDRAGIIQVVLEEESMPRELIEKAASLRSEYVIAVVGTVKKRSGAVNPNLSTGEIEIVPLELRIISESDVLPFPIEDGSRTKEELRLKHRYLDLRRPDLQRNFILRSQVAIKVRNILAREGFIEVETPILGKSTPEGARDYLVPSRVNQGSFYGLPQSPQLYKQLLMCSGYDRYFQIAKCFRDEDLRSDRQPEFTQVDIEMSFVDADDVIAINEKFVAELFLDIMNIEVKLPIPRLTWVEAMERFGSDKPDLRFSMELVDVTEIVSSSEFVVFKGAITAGGLVKGINVKGQGGMPRKKIDKLVDLAKNFGAKGLAYIAIQEDGSIKSSFSKFMTEEEVTGIITKMNGDSGDLLLFGADAKNVVWNVLGSLRLELGKQLELFNKNEFNFVWITEFPLLEWDEEQNRFTAVHHPFTMAMDEDLPLLESEPGKVRAKAYDLVLTGHELGGGSVRIHQSEVQSKVFKILGFTQEEAYSQFGFLLDAFKFGVPPHAGIAYGFDRIIMSMAMTENIRDVIAFPKNKDAVCMMTKAPGIAGDNQLEELGIELKKK